MGTNTPGPILTVAAPFAAGGPLRSGLRPPLRIPPAAKGQEGLAKDQLPLNSG